VKSGPTPPSAEKEFNETRLSDVLRLEEMDKPTIADEQVLVRVHAASVDRGTWHIIAGLPYPIRVAGFGLRKPKYLNPGRSLAGTIEAVGNEVTGFEPGDAVFGICDGSFAESVSEPTSWHPSRRTIPSMRRPRQDRHHGVWWRVKVFVVDELGSRPSLRRSGINTALTPLPRPADTPSIRRGGYQVRRVVTITVATKSSSTIDTGAQRARSAVLLVMILRTTATAE
jgi:hypothetical protein